MKILFTGGLPEWAEDKLTSSGHDVTAVEANTYVDQTLFARDIEAYDVYVSGGIEDCSGDVIKAGTNLKAIVFLGVDPSNYIDCATAKDLNIPVLTTPGANAGAVAELAIWQMMTAARKTSKMQSDIHSKIWKNQTGFELEGKTLGLIGAGPIAHKVAKIAKGFGMNVLYWTRSGEKPSMQGAYTELTPLLNVSDIVSLHIPQAAGEIMNASALSEMKEGSLLISTSPASLIDANALHQALLGDKISHAAFDCFYKEGDDCWSCPEYKLLSELGAEKLTLTPHAGWRTTEADNNMFAMAIDHISNLN